MSQSSLIRIHHADNVAVATSALAADFSTTYPVVLRLRQAVSTGHKVALKKIKTGQPVIKYGFTIGHASADIEAGEAIHSHNLATALTDNQTYTFNGATRYQPAHNHTLTFDGYRRDNGKVGIRNEVWIINTVGCVNHAAERIARECERRFAGECDGFRAFTHPFGCSQLGDDLDDTRNLLAALASHPNAAGVLVIGLGCENNQLDALLQRIDKPAQRLRFFAAQQVEDEIETGIAEVYSLLKVMQHDTRTAIPVSELVLGMKCGGSDAFSGMTANPLTGRVTDMLTTLGGAVLLTETPEMFGAEQVLMNRATSQAVFEDIGRLVNNFKQYFTDHQQPVYENPSPGNKAGGLTTLEEKSLGAIQKGGTAPVTGVLNYAEPLKTNGLVLLQAPGNDAVSATALAASGAHIVLFTTGRGTPLGFPVPTLKIASNSDLATRKPHWIDFDAGCVLNGVSLDDSARALFDLCLSTASGQLTKNEKNGSHEIAIWKRGVTL